jgi:hypothetical protein
MAATIHARAFIMLFAGRYDDEYCRKACLALKSGVRTTAVQDGKRISITTGFQEAERLTRALK